MNTTDKSGIKVMLLLAFAFIFAITCATIGSAWTSSEFIGGLT